ncbi:O-antigen ligase family protein [Deinococcus sp.]|uniref:O-antigen ligase family protein n=1 Tax=Deinococcus sp. TaxID=47478 RepID=UPI002869B592|nr:O-antigen ligase family protein [Deinococcus sp.]
MTVPIPEPTARVLRRVQPVHTAVIFAAALAVGVLATRQPTLAVLAGVGLLALTFFVQVGRRVPAYALALVGISLAGYAFLGRGYAYFGVPPLFIGELTMILGLIGAGMAVWQGTRLRHTWGLVALVVVFIAIGLRSTLPYYSQYHLDAIRDAATWYYSLFAVIVAVLVVNQNRFKWAIERYGKLVPYLLVFGPIALWTTNLFHSQVPTWPTSGGEIVYVKAGDLAVHLAGMMGFLLLGLVRVRVGAPAVIQSVMSRRHEWWWWTVWLAGTAGLISSRASLLSIIAALACILMFRPLARWGKLLFVAGAIFSLLVVINPRYETKSGRELSIDGLMVALESVAGGTGNNAVDGTRTWRLNWWNKIEGYTLHGDYFWTGKGYGVNLANTDGFQVHADQSLRNPHSIHFSILARSGVPGLVSWIALNGAFAFSLFLAFVRARRQGQIMWANVHLWLLAYWLAFIVNASFDVYIEGPQGGIWFWSVMGFGIAALELCRRGEEL